MFSPSKKLSLSNAGICYINLIKLINHYASVFTCTTDSSDRNLETGVQVQFTKSEPVPMKFEGHTFGQT